MSAGVYQDSCRVWLRFYPDPGCTALCSADGGTTRRWTWKKRKGQTEQTKMNYVLCYLNLPKN